MILTRKEPNKLLRVSLYYLVSRFIIDILAFHFAAYKYNNLLLGNLSVITSFLFISYIFYTIFIDDIRKSFILNAILVYSLLFIFDFIYCNQYLSDLHNHRYVSLTLPLKCGLVILYSLLYYHELIKEMYLEDLTRSYSFWLVSSLFVYHSVSLFCTSIYNSFYTWNFDRSFMPVIMVPYLFEVIMLIMIIIGLIRSKNNFELTEN